jgi:hypothetical protein
VGGLDIKKLSKKEYFKETSWRIESIGSVLGNGL